MVVDPTVGSAVITEKHQTGVIASTVFSHVIQNPGVEGAYPSGVQANKSNVPS